MTAMTFNSLHYEELQLKGMLFKYVINDETPHQDNHTSLINKSTVILVYQSW